MDGSRRESELDPSVADLRGLPPPTKLLMTAWRRYSSSTARRLRARTNKMTPPIMAQKAITPTTTPAAMPALLGPPEEEDFELEAPA